jgi:RNA polymerase sigma factor (sigma-70 family)
MQKGSQQEELIHDYLLQQDWALAFNLIVLKYQKNLYWHIRRIVTSHENTDDVLQNTLIKIWQGLPFFKKESRIYTWIYRIATNEALNFIEKNKHHLKNLAFDTSNYNIRSSDNASDVSGDTIQLKLEQAILTLPEKQRAVFHLKYFEEMKYEEISAVMNTTIGALKASYHHAVKKIEQYVLTH